MRLVGYESATGVSVGRLTEDDKVVDLGPLDSFWADPSAAVAGPVGASVDLDGLRLVPPVPAAARVLCVGLNYRAHVDEGVFEVPSHPSVFGRWTRSLTVSGAKVPVPPGEDGLDWEGELAAVVGTPLKGATPEQALAGVLGYAAFNDLTARRAQHRTTQWTVGKNADLSGPIGPIVTADEVGDPAEGLHLTTRVNGQLVQETTTDRMIFSVDRILSYLSEVMTLQPGDVVATGTPEGVGYRRTPPWLLGDGDDVEVQIERVGSVRVTIVGATAPADESDRGIA